MVWNARLDARLVAEAKSAWNARSVRVSLILRSISSVASSAMVRKARRSSVHRR